jgi:multisubunit Na+/H+ antiporter MnhB subunit
LALDRLPARSSFVDGLDAALLVSAGIAVVGLVLTVLFLPRTNAKEVHVRTDLKPQVIGAR